MSFTARTPSPRTVLNILYGFSALSILLVLYAMLTGSPTDSHIVRPSEPYIEEGSWTVRIIADDDHASKREGPEGVYWASEFWTGVLHRSADGTYDISWPEEGKQTLTSTKNHNGRGMELSALIEHKGRFYTCCDRTGIVYEIINPEKNADVVERYRLTDGDGTSAKPLKCEWASVYGSQLIFGSFGKEFADPITGKATGEGPMWVKVIDNEGVVHSVDWRPRWSALRAATNTSYPEGYLLHEAAFFEPQSQRWFFMPRRESNEPYNEVDDSSRGSNIIISADAKFHPSSIKYIRAHLSKDTKRGVSAFRFIPGRAHEIILLRTEETLAAGSESGTENEKVVTYVSIVDADTGAVLMPETLIGDHKWEGIEVARVVE